MKKIFYFENELEDEFSSAKIEPITIDENYNYSHNFLWDFCSFILQNFLSMPWKRWYGWKKFNLKFVGKEKFKPYRNTGYFIYANHTQEIGDTFIPSLANYPKRNFFIVNPENVSMKGLKKLVPLFGAVPIPNVRNGFEKFFNEIENRIKKKSSVTIYPEAHIWPYYTKIRNFKAVSFRYPVRLAVPAFTVTNTYHKGEKDDEAYIISYVDGPFFAESGLSEKEAAKKLRDVCYDAMCKRSLESDFELIEYKRRNKDDS